jgi:hypothetical protein
MWRGTLHLVTPQCRPRLDLLILTTLIFKESAMRVTMRSRE